MELLVLRSKLGKDCTLGDMMAGGIDGKWLGYTLEDPWKDSKVYGETCIPEGTYRVVVSESKRFKKLMPEILEVKGFTGVRIHGGNTKEHTLGCILLGRKRGIDSISDCAPALQELMEILKTGSHTIVIKKAENFNV